MNRKGEVVVGLLVAVSFIVGVLSLNHVKTTENVENRLQAVEKAVQE